MLKLQYFGHMMQRADSFEKILMLGKIEGRTRGWQRMRWLDGITNSMDMNLSKLRGSEGQGRLTWCSSGGHKESDMAELLNKKQQFFYIRQISITPTLKQIGVADNTNLP